jgi:hypothetical protein
MRCRTFVPNEEAWSVYVRACITAWTASNKACMKAGEPVAKPSKRPRTSAGLLAVSQTNPERRFKSLVFKG